MAFQSVPDTCLFQVGFAGPGGRRASFGLYSHNTAAPWDAGQMDTIGNALEQQVIDQYMPFVSDEWTFDEIEARDLEAEFGLVRSITVVPTVGGLASPSLPHNVALRAKFIGNPGAAPARGGIFLLPPAENQVVGAVVQAGPLADLLDAVQQMSAAVGTGAATHVIVSRYSGSSLVAQPDGQTLKKPTKRAAAVTNPVNTITLDSQVDSQRKRLPR